MPIPKIIFGPCPVCGGRGDDDQNPGPAFATPSSTPGPGYNLRYYMGRLMCKMCEKRLSNDAESRIKSAKNRETQEFWEKSGVRKNMAD